MNPPKKCKTFRNSLVETVSDKGMPCCLPESLATHLNRCDSCRLYYESLVVLPNLDLSKSIYTSALKARTLQRVDRASEASPSRHISVLSITLAIVGILSVVLPVWILSEVISFFFDSPAVALGLSLFIAHSLAGAAAGLCAIPLATRAASGESESSMIGGIQ